MCAGSCTPAEALATIARHQKQLTPVKVGLDRLSGARDALDMDDDAPVGFAGGAGAAAVLSAEREAMELSQVWEALAAPWNKVTISLSSCCLLRRAHG